MNNKLERYTGIKSVFKSLATDTQVAELSFIENRDTLTLHLSINGPENKKLEYYYIYGNLQVVRFDPDNEYRVMTTEPDKLHRHIRWDMEDFMNGKKIS